MRAECVARATGPRVAGASCSARDFSLRFENRPAARSFASEARLAALHSGSVAGAFARSRPAAASRGCSTSAGRRESRSAARDLGAAGRREAFRGVGARRRGRARKARSR